MVPGLSSANMLDRGDGRASRNCLERSLPACEPEAGLLPVIAAYGCWICEYGE